MAIAMDANQINIFEKRRDQGRRAARLSEDNPGLHRDEEAQFSRGSLNSTRRWPD